MRNFPFAKGSIGGVYHVAPQGKDPFTTHYLAWEPWLLVGGTFGLGFADGSSPVRLALGAWLGLPPLEVSHGERVWALTLAIGVRAFGGTTQLYFTPKIWRLTPFVLHS